MTSEELIAELRTGLLASAAFVRGNNDREMRMHTALNAVDEVERRLKRLEHDCDKFKWQVKDTCDRAEKAEAALKEARP